MLQSLEELVTFDVIPLVRTALKERPSSSAPSKS
jgi:hypothetical protein